MNTIIDMVMTPTARRTFMAGVLLSALSFFATAAWSNDSKDTLTWSGCGIAKNAFMQEIAAAFEKKTGVKVELKGGGATRGIRDVAQGTSDLGGTCRNVLIDPKTDNPLPQERRLSLDPVAWDALVAIVHTSNPVNNISMQQMRDVLTGKIKNWNQLGGADAKIVLYVREGKISGVGRSLRELLFLNYDQDFTTDAQLVKSSGPLEKAIESESVYGFGITGSSSAKKRNVKILQLEGKLPTFDNLKRGDYPLYRPLYLVTRQADPNPNVTLFKDFIRSSEGKDIMRKVGTIPYEDAISFWMGYLAQARKAQNTGLQ